MTPAQPCEESPCCPGCDDVIGAPLTFLRAREVGVRDHGAAVELLEAKHPTAKNIKNNVARCYALTAKGRKRLEQRSVLSRGVGSSC
jgi:hypothetical protein